MSETGPDQTPSAANRRFGRRRYQTSVWILAAIGLVGGVIGGLIVALTGLGGSGSSSTALSTRTACVASAVARDALPSIVTVHTVNGSERGNGSGEIIRTGGYILTNDHVIARAANGGEISVRYADGSTSGATVVGRDPLTDLAVVKAGDDAAGRPVIAMGSSSDLRVGQPVVALGAPLGLYSTVTAGIVSALDRYIPVPVTEGVTAHLVDAIQTDASINPGNSGGALVDCAGRLVGINSAIVTVPNSAGETGGGSVGLGFAVPVDLAIPLADQLIKAGHVNHPTFGVQAQTVGPSAGGETGGPTGVLVTAIDPNGPAAKAGLRVGDVITSVDGQPALSVAVLEKATLTRRPGDSVQVEYSRGGNSATATITLGS